jgi:phenylalanine-4-hydroxylase
MMNLQSMAQTNDGRVAAAYTSMWTTMYNVYVPHGAQYACGLYLEGLPKLPFRPDALPDLRAINDALSKLTGWQAVDMGPLERYITSDEWFGHFAEKEFPVPYYMRPLTQLEFATRGDMFHECVCHLPYFTDTAFADTASLFASIYLAARERQRGDIGRIWWFTAEFGLVREREELKVFGAGLLSSRAECARAFSPGMPRVPFDLQRAVDTPQGYETMHDFYFILDDTDHMRRILLDYAAREKIPA